MRRNSLYLTLCLVLVLISAGHSSAQKLVKTSGEAQMELRDDLSMKEAKNMVKELAVINALEKAFGKVIIQGNATYITNMQTGEQVESNSVFNSIANTSVKGEMVEIIKEDYTEVTGIKIIDNKKQEVIDLKCEITIKAKEINTPPVEFTSQTLACDHIRCATTAFMEGDDLFLSFSSPVSGYVWVYLDDGNNAQCLLPYTSTPAEHEGGFPVAADKTYLFFNNSAVAHHVPDVNFNIDTYELYAEKEQDLNRMFVIFSKTPVNKPRFKKTDASDFLSKAEIEEGFNVPTTIESEDFQKWLNKQRSYRTDEMQVSIIDITISKK
ncbi:MAG: hypothetical protein ACOC0C_06855 [Bacteroidota bacterium]